MDDLNIKKIFDIFDKYPIEGVEENSSLYKNSFRFKIGMFIKVIVYGEEWKKSVINLFSKSTTDMDLEDIDNAGEFMLHTRAWFWIKQFEFDNEDCIEALDELSNSDIKTSLSSSISYFEKIEEFEKCSFLLKIKNLVK